jgi:uncharacterized protein (DUF1501 family)
MAALKTGLGDTWSKTAVLVITEFGRTARMNGTRGTDHGTGTVAFVAGGRVAGGRVLANWPGLSPGNLLEDRDLQPTADLRSIAKGLLANHLNLPPAALATVFPNSAEAAPVSGLLLA